MSWLNGTTTRFCNNSGVDGVLQEFLDFVCGNMYEETVGTGDGSLVDFSVTLSNTPIALGQCRIRFRIAGVDYECWDDGEGGFVHQYIDYANSSLDNATGALVLKFTAAISDTYVIKAKYCTANANGNDWFIERQDTTKTNAGAEAFSGLLLQEVVLKNSGISYKEFICIGIREFQYVAGNCWNWNLNLYKEWTVTNEAASCPWNSNSVFTGKTGYDSTWKNFNEHNSIAFKDDSIKYWFIVNKRRIIVISRQANSSYMSAYLGGIRRLCAPSDYAYPQIVCGGFASNLGYSSTSVYGVGHNANIFWWGISPENLIIVGDVNYDKIEPGQSITWTGAVGKDMNDKVILYPEYVVQSDALGDLYRKNLGELDGLFLTPCSSLVSEDIITVDGVDYLVFQNVHRLTYFDYSAVRLD